MTILATLPFSSSWWAAIGAPMGNHLWQSTLFAAVAGLLTLLLRKNRAETRYSLWLIASAKFLLPFCLLIGTGSHLRSSNRPTISPTSIYAVTQVISEPFAAVNPSLLAAPASESRQAALLRSLPTVLLIVWSSGCAAVVFLWWRRRQRTVAALRGALSTQAGREFEMLRLLERNSAITRHIELKISESTLEPGILGIFRPVLLLPTGISNRLSDAQLKAIITHELCHVRRRDNLAATLHMLVEAVFWFHPLVWWIGARLVDEREHACDEEVLKLGSDPQAYAEGILKVCEFYVESPLLCAAGATGSNLKKRIEAIMTHRTAHQLEGGKKLLLAAMGIAAVTAPIAMGLAHPAPVRIRPQAQGADALVPEYQVLSLKPNKSGNTIDKLILFRPNRFTATNFTLRGLICVAYGVQDSQISGGPDWLSSEKYDIEANVDGSVAEAVSNFTVEPQRIMLQHLLSDQFKLSLHHETRDLPVYELVVAKDGPKLSEANPGGTSRTSDKNPDRKGRTSRLFFSGTRLTGEAVSPAALVGPLSLLLGRPVLDKTGLKGEYDFTLDWLAPLRVPESAPFLLKAVPEHAEALAKVHAIEAASILMAVSDQLGLELTPEIGPVETLVIDHAEEIMGERSSQTQPRDQGRAESVAASMPPARVYKAVSIKPHRSATSLAPTWNFPADGFAATHVTLQSLIQWAYGVEGFQISGAPDWLNTDRYDVEAKVDSSVANELRNLSEEQRRAKQQPMLLELLADGFKLDVHRETRELPVYDLVITDNGTKLQQAPAGESPRMRFGSGLIAGQSAPIGLAENGRPSLVRMLSLELQRPVLDKTGLKGTYDFSLRWTSAASQSVEHGPSILAAVQEQLGLKLLPSNEQTAPVQVLVVDHAERVTSNQEVNAADLN